MKRPVLLLAAVATALLATSCSAQPSASPTSTLSAPSPSPSATATATATESSSDYYESMKSQGSSIGGSSGSISTSSGSSGTSIVTGKPGVATDAQMAVIDKVARALANGKYDDAATAGYYVFGSNGSLTQDTEKMASLRDKHADYFNTAKEAFAKGCKLVPESINSSGVIYTNMICNDGTTPDVSIHAQFMSGKLVYVDAT